MKRLLAYILPLAALLVRCEPAYPATPITGAVRYNSDTTGTNTQSGAVTVTLRTNLFAGTLTATNRLSVGTGTTSPGSIDLYSTNGTYLLTMTVTNNGSFLLWYGTTNLFSVAIPSGHAGGGTLFLSDDGTYKAPTDGTANWTASGTTNSTLAGTATLHDLIATNDVTASNLKLGHAALTADSAVTNFVADFTAEAYRTITAAADVNLLQSTNREVVRTVTLFIEPSGGDRNLTINSSWKKLNTFNSVVTNGTTAVISLTTKGAAETDVFAAFAITQ